MNLEANNGECKSYKNKIFIVQPQKKYEFNYDKINTVEDIKIILKTFKITMSGDAVEINGLRQYVKEIDS